MIFERLRNWAADKVWTDSDVTIGTGYMFRWFVIPRNPLMNIYLHQYVGNDDDRALHDHPWWSFSLMLHGSLLEFDADGVREIVEGESRFRTARYAHRLMLSRDWQAITLFITGPRIRRWGFHCPNGWRHWKDFVHPDDPGQIGPGCD